MIVGRIWHISLAYKKMLPYLDTDQHEQNSNRRQSPVTPAGFKILSRFLMSNLGYLFERGLLSVDTRDWTHASNIHWGLPSKMSAVHPKFHFLLIKERMSWLLHPHLPKILGKYTWLVVDLPLWKIWKSVGARLFPIYGEKKCSKPPTRYVYIYIDLVVHLPGLDK